MKMEKHYERTLITEEIFEEKNGFYVKMYIQIFYDDNGDFIDSQDVETSELYREAYNNEVLHIIGDVRYLVNVQNETFYRTKKVALVRTNIRL